MKRADHSLVFLVFLLEINQYSPWHFCSDFTSFLDWEQLSMVVLIRMTFHDELIQSISFIRVLLFG